MVERFRPVYHVTPPAGWMNDPNGLVYFAGEYHLFYQHIPLPEWNMPGVPGLPHWGHAVSPDLIQWTHLPVALYPDHLGVIYSGSVVVDSHDTSGFFDGQPGLVAIFTHHNKQDIPQGPEVQSIAYSTDRGRTWTMYAGNPVIINPGHKDFRDPKVFWHASTQSWIMVVTFHGDRVHFYRSDNLREWILAGEFGVGQGSHEGIWECPDLFELPIDGHAALTKWVLHLSAYHQTALADHVGMQYFIGDFDGHTFTNDNPAETVLTSDYGKDNYAAVTWSSTPDDRRLMIGWMSNWTYARAVPTTTWKGAMTIPRALSLRQCLEGIRLFQEPVVEVQRLRGQHISYSPQSLTPQAGLWIPETADALEIVLRLQPGNASECGVQIRTSDESCYATLGYDVQNATLFIDRAQSGHVQEIGAGYATRQGGSLSSVEGAITLHIFLDSSSIEVFGNDGECVVTSLIFPTASRAGLELYVTDSEAQLISLDLYHLAATEK